MNLTWKRPLGSILVAISLFVLSGCFGGGSNIQIDGVRGPSVELQADRIYINTVFENIEIDDELQYNIPKFDNSFVELKTDAQSGGTAFNVHIFLEDILGDLGDILDPQTLPGGRALPGVASGSLPAAAFTLTKWHNITVYVGKDVFGVFIPYDMKIDGSIATFRFYIKGKKAGNISIVGRDQNGENAGILLLLDMDAKTKKYLKKHYKKYNDLY